MSYEPRIPYRLNCRHYESDCDICDDEDEDERLPDILRLRKIRRQAIRTIEDLQNPPFWVPRSEKLVMLKRSFMYELIYDEAMDAIKELCRIPVYASSDDGLVDCSSDSSDSSDSSA